MRPYCWQLLKAENWVAAEVALREALWSDGVPLESEEEEPAASVGWCEFKSAPKPAKGKKKAKPGEACFAPRRFVVTLAPNGPVCNITDSAALPCCALFIFLSIGATVTP